MSCSPSQHTELIVIKLITFTLFKGENVIFSFYNKKLQLQGNLYKSFILSRLQIFTTIKFTNVHVFQQLVFIPQKTFKQAPGP